MRLFDCCKRHRVQDISEPSTARTPYSVSDLLANRRNEIIADHNILYRDKKLYSNKIFSAMRVVKENGNLTADQINALKVCFKDEDVAELIRANNIPIVEFSL